MDFRGDLPAAAETTSSFRKRLDTAETHETLNQDLLDEESTSKLLEVMRNSEIWKNVAPGVNMEKWIGQANYRKK